MTKLGGPFPRFQCLTLQCDTSTLNKKAQKGEVGIPFCALDCTAIASAMCSDDRRRLRFLLAFVFSRLTER